MALAVASLGGEARKGGKDGKGGKEYKSSSYAIFAAQEPSCGRAKSLSSVVRSFPSTEILRLRPQNDILVACSTRHFGGFSTSLDAARSDTLAG